MTVEVGTMAAMLAARLSTLIDAAGVVVTDDADAISDTGEPGGITVVALSRWTPGDLASLGRRAVAAARTVLPVRQDGAVTLLGPVVGPGLPGCLECAEDARLRMLSLPGERPGVTFGGPTPPTVLPVIAALVASVARDPAVAASTMWTFNGADGAVAAHRPAPRPQCPVCSPRPDDGPEAVRLILTSRHVARSR